MLDLQQLNLYAVATNIGCGIEGETTTEEFSRQVAESEHSAVVGRRDSGVTGDERYSIIPRIQFSNGGELNLRHQAIRSPHLYTCTIIKTSRN